MTAHEIDHDEMVLISQYYPAMSYLSPPLPPVEEEVGGGGGGGGGEGKARRRRKKNKGGGENSSGFRKRKLNQEQVNLLEQSFEDEHKLESERKDKLAAELGLDPRQVAVWFQNRRARWKSKKLEEEYTKLKTQNDSTVLEKCRLESEVLKLKEQLTEVEREMQKMLENSNNSPTSSFSMEAMEMQQPPFLGEFGMEGLENVFYIPESNHIPGLEWANII